MRWLNISAAANVMVLMVDSTDHVTGKTGLTLTVTASKDGGAFASISPTVTERGNGWYNVALTASHTDTLGDLALHITGTAADPTDLLVFVSAVNPKDSQDFGLSRLDLNTSDVAPAVATYVWGDDPTAYGAGTAGQFLTAAFDNSITIQADTNDIQTRLPAALVSGRMDASVGAMASDVLTAAALAADAVADIQSGLATLASQTTIAGYIDTEVTAIQAACVAIQAKTDNLPAAPAATGDIPTASANAAAVWAKTLP